MALRNSELVGAIKTLPASLSPQLLSYPEIPVAIPTFGPRIGMHAQREKYNSVPFFLAQSGQVSQGSPF
jgi:hypothetical protein